MEKRLQKILSEMGITSRRKAEDLIFEGRVTVNGRIATIGTKADPVKDHIKVDGKLLIRPEPKVYIMFNKPKNVVTSLHDPEGRPTVKDFLKGVKYRVFPVGRLDYDSEGLLLLTNDGDFAHAVLHPSKKISKTYLVKVKGILDEEEIEKLKSGVRLRDGMTLPAKVKKIKRTENNSWLEMTIYEGKKRQIRRMLEKTGHDVLKLKRIRVDGLELGKLEPGTFRYLTPEERDKIKKEVEVA
ncbi:MAG: pseudouridine synthase [Nitrospirae bacterium CG_4_10_14_0_8_um_filter_41_23]|nr:rRNA pseudouridine synthase [Nitrospirota bacterium]OIP59975.1 MAG: pseudouridine synthase [Nitrospirae bacterium CG2_30_41_42]PIQ93851.1 MAG: pseudouridine synthase [Nitrospirae bacterium CG11_big_fil_rev_8_21_14_0_20_41_14]PIV40948.1 MAG: pseudouridine synthase [Nitrospirae bacterium CG02_land_8_20_14_3_00_41_53]PIW87064.1 MAG: pseudouridine synthase [Nitrospirae bacterium CG_4_8_14_3_um_filter_41_47]PIY86725.1 MAG: pseudouridine synthase [Nitrospirae bacterium CG_4_10_14_0_8_um_filter_41